MQLHEEQEKALDELYKRYKRGERESILSGIAGSGKSTIIKILTEELIGLSPTEIVYGTLTGRASKILRIKGLPSLTLHKILYNTKMINNKPFFVLRDQEDFEGIEVLIVDEISMVPQKIIDDIRKVGLKIIGLGDPFQLDAIGKPNTLLQSPHAILRTPHRQALENPIFYWATEIRENHRYPTLGIHGDNMLVTNSFRDLPDEHILSSEIILAGYNKTRVEINNSIRYKLNKHGLLVPEDKVIFLKNNWDNLSTFEEPVVNGAIGIVKTVGEEKTKYVEEYSPKARRKITKEVKVIPTTIQCIEDGGIWTSDVVKKGIGCEKIEFENVGMADYLDHGHCITIHKAQGSEFFKGIYINQTFGDDLNKLRTAYTGLTRFKEKCIWTNRY